MHPWRLCTTERAIGTLQKNYRVSLCVSDARDPHVKETRDVSDVQDEAGEEAPSQNLGVRNFGVVGQCKSDSPNSLPRVTTR
jgi:hypothetical protein